jgi:hypothetical protein
MVQNSARPGLRFDSDNAKLIPTIPDALVKSSPSLLSKATKPNSGELIRSTELEQISDANQIDYTLQKLRSRERYSAERSDSISTPQQPKNSKI